MDISNGSARVIRVAHSCEVEVRFHLPPEQLRRYITTFYQAEWTIQDGQRLVDHLLPEWANLRFHSGSLPEGLTQAGMRIANSSFVVTGPSSEAVRFSLGASRMWGVGLLPLGWAKFVRAPAAGFANAVVNGFAHPTFASFTPLARTIFAQDPDPAGELARITQFFLARMDGPVPEEAEITAIHRALVDQDTATVASLASSRG